MKKRITSKITYKISDCEIRQFNKIVTISYSGEIVCEITNVKNYTEIISLIKCMFQGGLMYAKISSFELKRMYKGTEKSTFSKKINEVIEEVLDTAKSLKNEKVVERSIEKAKKWIYTVNNLFRSISKNDISNSIVYEDPIQNLRLNLH